MVGIVLEGEAAATERKRLAAEGTEIPVAIRERDAHGKKTALWMHLGRMRRSPGSLAVRSVKEKSPG